MSEYVVSHENASRVDTPRRVARRGAGRPNAEVSEHKHLALIEAAVEEFTTRGFNGASLRAIAAKAEISTRTLFNRYPDKVTLFAAAIDHLSKQIGEVVSASGEDIESALVAYAIAMQRQLSNDRSRRLTMLIFREGAEFDAVRQVARLQFEKYQVAPVVAILRQHGFAGDDVRAMATQFVVMALGEWQRRLLFGGGDLQPSEMERHAHFVSRIFMYGINGLGKIDPSSGNSAK